MITIPAGGEFAVWDLSIDSNQATVTDWDLTTATTTNTTGWQTDGQGLPLEIAVVITSGTVQFKADGNGSWATLISGTSFPTPQGGVALSFRTASGGTAATVQVAAKVRLT